MLKLMNLSVPLGTDKEQLYQIVAKKLHISSSEIQSCTLLKKSLDARKKPRITEVLTVALELKYEKRVQNRWKNDRNIQPYLPFHYQIPQKQLNESARPVIVGFGPAGMFSAYYLAKAGLRPIVLERGACVEERQRDVALFRETGVLNPSSNIQFGEGGAGTFSDGKLTTGIKDPRIRFVLETFTKHGAPKEILYLSKPHIGTDRLVDVVRNMRMEIQKEGGEIRFHSCLKEIYQKQGKLTGVAYTQNGKTYEIAASQCILAVGHSARDVFSTLYEDGIQLIQKSFAVGVRIEHPQEVIDRAMYGRPAEPPLLPAADYKLVVHLPNGHSMYTFCMCPGGEVVAASSEKDYLVVNGMSYYARDGKNANSALLVGVSPSDLKGEHPLTGMHFQEEIEKKAFLAGGGTFAAPVCTVRDFLAGATPESLGSVEPSYRPGVYLASPDVYLPQFVTETLRLGIPQMDRKIHGFAMPDAVLTGVESRSSSPVRIVRRVENCESVSLQGLFPCGEGAGYAGGITSAAVDGLRCAECIAQNYQN